MPIWGTWMARACWRFATARRPGLAVACATWRCWRPPSWVPARRCGTASATVEPPPCCPSSHFLRELTAETRWQPPAARACSALRRPQPAPALLRLPQAARARHPRSRARLPRGPGHGPARRLAGRRRRQARPGGRRGRDLAARPRQRPQRRRARRPGRARRKGSAWRRRRCAASPPSSAAAASPSTG